MSNRRFVGQFLLPLTFLGLVDGMGSVSAATMITLASPHQAYLGLFGASTWGAGDVNQDGVPDVMVGAVGEQRCYVFSGRDSSVLLELASPNQEAAGRFGDRVAPAGDVNRDGVPDIMVGAWGEDPGNSPLDTGRAYVFSGKNGSVLFTFRSPHQEKNGHFGVAVFEAGDLDQDGHPDVIVGAEFEDPGASPTDAGRAYVFSGRDGHLILELQSPNEEIEGRFGQFVSSGGDVDQDGVPDLLVAAYQESPGNSPDEAGRVYLLSGRDGSMLFELKSPNEEDDGYFGYIATQGGDIDLDGRGDIIVGASKEGPAPGPPHAGRAYVFSGRDGSLVFELKSPNEEERGGFGQWASAAGDINLDGHPDIIVGAFNEGKRPGSEGQHRFGSGHAYVFSGRDGSLLVSLTSPNSEQDGAFGSSVAGPGDLDQDGVPDLVVGAFAEDPGISPLNAGRTYLIKSLSQAEAR